MKLTQNKKILPLIKLPLRICKTRSKSQFSGSIYIKEAEFISSKFSNLKHLIVCVVIFRTSKPYLMFLIKMTMKFNCY